MGWFVLLFRKTYWFDMRHCFLRDILNLTCRKRVNPGLEGKTKCSALGSFFPFSVEDGERSL